VPLTDLAAVSADPAEPAWRVVTGGWLATEPGAAIPAEVGATLAAATFAGRGDGAGGPVLRYCEIRHAGGAIASSARRSGSSMGNRDGAFLLHLVGLVDDDHDAAAITRHLDATKAELGPHLSRRTYLNVLDGPARAGAAASSIDADDLAAIARVQADVDAQHMLRFGVDHGCRDAEPGRAGSA